MHIDAQDLSEQPVGVLRVIVEIRVGPEIVAAAAIAGGDIQIIGLSRAKADPAGFVIAQIGGWAMFRIGVPAVLATSPEA